MLFTYAVLNVFISIISQAWEEVHFEAAQSGSPDQLVPNHRRARGRRLHTVMSFDDDEDDDLRAELRLAQLCTGLEAQLDEVRSVMRSLKRGQSAGGGE